MHAPAGSSTPPRLSSAASAGEKIGPTVAPRWMRDLDPEYASRDGLHAAEQALKWQLPLALNPIGSTLIRHLLRFGRPDSALAVYEMFRKRSPQFTMDSVGDLRILAEYAESVGKEELATSMRLETPVVHPPG